MSGFKEKVKNITITDTEIICNEIETANAIVNKLITEIRAAENPMPCKEGE